MSVHPFTTSSSAADVDLDCTDGGIYFLMDLFKQESCYSYHLLSAVMK